MSGLAWLLLLIFALWKNVSIPLLNLDALFYYSASGYAVLFKEKVEGEIQPFQKKYGLLSLFLAGLYCGFLEDLGHFCIIHRVHTVLIRFLGVLVLYSILKEIPFKPAGSTVKTAFSLCHPFSLGPLF